MNNSSFCRISNGAIRPKIALTSLLFSLLFVLSGFANQISGFVWNDVNRDGIQDLGEPGISNVSVRLRDFATSNLVEATFTDANGNYLISDPPPDTYFLEVHVFSPSLVISYAWGVSPKDQGGNDNVDSDLNPSSTLTDTFVYSGVAITNLDAGFYLLEPGVTVTKLANDEFKDAPEDTALYVTNGTWVTYTYVVTNSGETHLSNILVYDDVLDAFVIDYVCSLPLVPPLAPGGTLTFSTTVVINASVTNIAEVSAFPVDPKTCNDIEEFGPVFDDNDAVVIVIAPSVSIVKSLIIPTGRSTEVGETNVFRIVITNIGDVPLDVVPLVDTYDTNLLAFVSAVPPPVNGANDGTLNWSQLGPLGVGGSVTVTTWFASINLGVGTNVVVTIPTLTNTVPVEPATDVEVFTNINPNVEVIKTFNSATEPDTNGYFVVTYTLTVTNSGGSTTFYDLTDTPAFDGNISVLSNNVSGQISTNIAGAGPFSLATDTLIASGASHEYILMMYAQLSPEILSGETTVSICGEQTQVPQPGQGLFNAATVIFGLFDLEDSDDDCGNVPPFLIINKSFDAATEPDQEGNFVVTYTLTVQNTGGTQGFYDLTDSPGFDANITVLSNNVSGHIAINLPGPGAYNLVSSESIDPGATHTYNLEVHAQLSLAVLNGETNVSQCASSQVGFVAGQGLYNLASVVYGDSSTYIEDDACADVQPFLVLNKTFDSATEPDLDGNFIVTYTIMVQNVGGTDGLYDLSDTPDFDPNILVFSNDVSGHITVSIDGAGPYLLASGESIIAGATHTYVLNIYAQLDSSVLDGSTTVSQCELVQGEYEAGQGLFNQATVTYGIRQTQITDEDCGDVPAVIQLLKTFDSASEADLDGNFVITYTITVWNVGGSEGIYDLTDTPAFDTNIIVSGVSVSDHVVVVIPGAGPYTLATGESIAPGATHTYTLVITAQLSAAVLNGDTSVSVCEDRFGLITGQGLFNSATVVYGDSDTEITDDDCGDVPPFLLLDKTFDSATEPNQDGTFNATYVITVRNVGGSTGSFDLTDTPQFDGNITITGANITVASTTISGSLLGQPTYTRAAASGSDNSCALSAVVSGSTVPYLSVPILAASTNPFTAFVSGGLNDPYMFLYCNFDSTDPTNNLLASNDDYNGLQSGFDESFNISLTPGQTYYLVISLFTAGNIGSGDFVVALSNASVNGSAEVAGPGPYTLASGELIAAGSTLSFTVTVHGVLSAAVLEGQTTLSQCGESTGTPQAGEGLFNEALLVYGESETEIIDEACGDVPALIMLDKTFVSATVPDTSGRFVVTYTIDVQNVGGSTGVYYLTDNQLFDPNVTVNSNNVSGHIVTNIAGAGPYNLVTNESIAVGVSHQYTMNLHARLSEAVMRGQATVSTCQAQSGLLNQAVLVYGESLDIQLTAEDCGDLTLPASVLIGDTVWVDANSNGNTDENLALFGLNNVRVDLFHGIDGVTNFVSFRISGPGNGQLGYYVFSNLPPYGVYAAQVVLSSVPPGFPVITTPSRYTLNTATAFTGGVFTNADFGFNNEYGTPIELISFTARLADGGVKLAWETAWEVDTLGYHLYRASAQNPDQRIRVNEVLIPGLGAEGGYSYEWTDLNVSADADYLYWLAEVAVNGDVAWYGPVAVHMGEIQRGKDLASATLEAGVGSLVRIRFESLVAAGIPLSQLEAVKLQVFINGNQVARLVSADRESLQAGDYLLIYVPTSMDDQIVSIRQTETDDALTMNWVYARPRAGGGSVGVAEAGTEGQTEFDYTPDLIRMLISGFTSPVVWALDITDPVVPSILYGHATVSGAEDGEYAIYLSVAASESVKGLAVQDERVIDLEDFKRE